MLSSTSSLQTEPSKHPQDVSTSTNLCSTVVSEHNYCLKPNDSLLRILNINVCGPTSKLEIECREFLELISSYDVVCMQETKLDNFDNERVQELLGKEGFVAYFRNRYDKTNKKSGGNTNRSQRSLLQVLYTL